MKTYRSKILIAGGVLLLGLAAWAASPPAPSTPPAEAPAATEPAAPAERQEASPPAATPAPAPSSSTGPSPQRFVPSEQVRADFDVSFPIDI